VQNYCHDPPTYFTYSNPSADWIVPATGNFAAMEAFKNDPDAKLLYTYADQVEDCIGSGFTGDCANWTGFGTEFAFLHTGLSPM